MPRTAGVSCNSLTELSRRRPKPRTVARCVSRVPIRLLTSWTLTVLSDMVSTLAQNIFDGLAALRRDITRRRLLAQTVERCTNEVIGVRRTVALGHNVCTPITSNTARIGPPAITPVPSWPEPEDTPMRHAYRALRVAGSRSSTAP